MKNLFFIVIILSLFSCKKTELPTDLRIKTENFYINDSLIGHVEYEYSTFNNFLETETVDMGSSYYVKHKYYYMNDSILIDEDGSDGLATIKNLISIYITGTKHIISKIRIYNKVSLTTTYERNYNYDVNDQITQIDYYTSKQAYDFSYTSGNLASLKVLFPKIIPPYGTDTTQINFSYISRVKQPGINFDFLINSFSIPVINENALNIELTGCTFNTTDKLMQTYQFTTFGHVVAGGDPVTTYSYDFDNKGRVQTKTFKTESVSIPSTKTYKVIYAYF